MLNLYALDFTGRILVLENVRSKVHFKMLKSENHSFLCNNYDKASFLVQRKTLERQGNKNSQKISFKFCYILYNQEIRLNPQGGDRFMLNVLRDRKIIKFNYDSVQGLLEITKIF